MCFGLHPGSNKEGGNNNNDNKKQTKKSGKMRQAMPGVKCLALWEF